MKKIKRHLNFGIGFNSNFKAGLELFGVRCKLSRFIFIFCFLSSVLCLLTTAALCSDRSVSFNKEALLDKINENSLMNDIRWTENRGQLTVNRGQNEEFYNSIKYYAKVPWGYFLIKDDNAIILNFIKPIKYTKDNIVILVEQPDWEEYAGEELDLSSKKIAKLKEEGVVKANGKEIYLETTYKTKDQRPKTEDRNYKLQTTNYQLLSDFNLSYRSYNLYLSLNGKNPVRIEPQGERAEKQSFFKGKDPEKWISGVTTYNEVWAYFEDGVIFRFYPKAEGRGQKIEKEIIISQGINLEDIYLTYASEDEFNLTTRDASDIRGNQGIQGKQRKHIPECPTYAVGQGGSRLIIEFDGYEFTEEVPFAYVIDNNGNTKEVEARYVINRERKTENRRQKIEISDQKKLSAIRYPLFANYVQISSAWSGEGTFIFDPLLASTYVSGGENDYAYGITLDTSGNVYVTGYAYSTDFPTTTGAYDETGDGSTSYYDVFISKLSSDLTALSASTYLGGSGYDCGNCLTLDTSGNVYVTGYTRSTDFPTTTGAYDETGDGSTSYYDVFISKLSSDLTALSASTYLGGSGYDCGNCLTLDTSGNVYVTGYTRSTDFPTTTGAYDETGDGSTSYDDVVISKLSSDLTALSASTYLGGSVDDRGNCLTLDSSNNAYVTGYAYSTDFPTTTGAYDETGDGSTTYRDVFISKLSSDLSFMEYTGGNEDGYGRGVYSTDTEVGFGTKSQLGFTTSPSNSTAGVAFPTQPVVAIQDEYGNTVTTATDNVTVAISSNPNNGILSGTATIAAVLGVATYPGAVGLSIDEPGQGYTLEATSGGLTPDTSSTFNITGKPWVSAISGSQLTDGTKKVTITYTACDIESDPCNVSAAALAQYSLNNADWFNATTSGTKTSITATPSGTQHSDLYWEAGTDSNNTEDSEVYFRLKLNDGTYDSPSYETSSSFALDTKAPVISVATAFSSSPEGGDTSIQLSSTWTDGNAGSAASLFYYDLDGGGYSAGDAGSSGTLSPTDTVSVGSTLTGHSYFSAIKSTLTDDYGNTSAESEDTTDVGVKPYTPAAPTVQNATQYTLDVIVNKNASEASGLSYCIYISPAVGGNNYVQADGSIGASAVWQDISSWGTKTITGLSLGVTYSFKTKSRNFHVTAAESDFSSTASLATSPVGAKEYDLKMSYRYISNTQLEFLVWLELGGQAVTDVSDTGTVTLYDSDGSSIGITGGSDASPDSQGVYSMTITRSSGTFSTGASYYAKASLPYKGTTYSETLSFSIADTVGISEILVDTGTTIPGVLTTIEGKIDTLTSTADAILQDTETTIPGVLTTMEGKLDTIDGVVDAILIDTGTTLADEITTAKTDIIAELDKGPQAKILNRPTTVKSGGMVTIRYKTDSGLSPTIDVYDAGNTKRVNSVSMAEIDTTGIYEYDLTLSSGWGTGDFTVICSELTKSSVDSMILTVASYDIAQLGADIADVSTDVGTVDTVVDSIYTSVGANLAATLSTVSSNVTTIDTNVDTLLTRTASIKTTAEDTNSDIAAMQTNVNTIISKWGAYESKDLLSDTGDLGTYIGTPSDASGTDTVFGKIAQVYDATGTISTASTYAQNAYDEVGSLRNEINLNGKTETAYSMLVDLRDTLSNLQSSVSAISTEVGAGGAEDIQASINANLAELKNMIATEGYKGAIAEVAEEEAPAAETSMVELSNQLSELKALIEVSKLLVEEATEKPVIESWFEMR